MKKENRRMNSKIDSIKSTIIEEEISLWESRVSEKEDEALSLSIQIQDLKIAMNVFLGEYNARVRL